ncbi:hypothetical protein EON63_02750 [archaeon]|nr:MAG: hypothetical protein EON63_02750 [archaeon]
MAFNDTLIYKYTDEHIHTHTHTHTYQMQESKFRVHVPNYGNHKLMSTAKLLNDKELRSYQETSDPLANPSNPSSLSPPSVAVSDEGRKRLKLEAMAKKVEALKAKRNAL